MGNATGRRSGGRWEATPFWEWTERRPNGCLEWTGGRNGDGYGKWTPPGEPRPRRAHRVAWELTNGAIPDGMMVCHHCDNPPCVDPKHLFLGTNADNMADAARKGRIVRTLPQPTPEQHARGEAHGHAKLTDAIIIEMRELRAAGWTYSQLAEHFDVHIGTPGRVCRRESWSHVG